MSRLTAGLLTAAALLGAGAAPASAATGADAISAAPELYFSQPGTVANNLSFTTQSGEPVSTTEHCGKEFAVARTAWWRFTGTGQTITLSTGQSTFDTVLAVYDAPTGVPIAGNRVACNDDQTPSIKTSLTSFSSERGKNYLVQVGSQGLAPRGAIDVRASAPRPVNDDRIDPSTLTAGAPSTISNAGASQEPGETLTCGANSYAATMWFKWRADAIGDAVVTATALFGDTVVAVYPPASAAPTVCAASTLPTVPVRTAPGDYLIQVATKGSNVGGLGTGQITARVDFVVDPDVDGDGDLKSTDCDDNDPGRRHGLAEVFDDDIDQDCDDVDAENPDRDRDGEARPGDCNDSNAAIHHGARDIPGNAVDEDCAGGPAPFPRVDSIVRTGWRLKPFRLTDLAVVRAVESRVEVTCKGKGCPFKKDVVKLKKEQATRSILDRKLKHARLGKGAVLEVRITLDEHVGFLRRMTVGAAGKQPKLSDLCLPVGGAKPTKC